MTPQPIVPGPVYKLAWSVLKLCPEYKAFQDGRLSRVEYSVFLDRIAPQLIAAGLPPEDVHFAKRYPQSDSGFVSQTLERLAARGVLPEARYDSDAYDALAASLGTDYDHGDFRTYIYPEESRLLFAFVDIVRPKSAIFLGSYYGYWATVAMRSIATNGGSIVLVDPDPRAQAIATRNVDRAGMDHAVEIAIATGQDYLRTAPRSFDFVVLDAEGPRTHADPEQRGKAIYAPLLRHVLPHITRDAYLVCHNILFEDIADCPYFDGVIARNRQELGPFLEIARREFPDFVECASTEGVGIGRRGR